PTNNWMAPADAKAKAGEYFKGTMRGRTMYAIPYVMGPAGSAMSRTGIMVTDSPYVVASMHIMARVGDVAIRAMRRVDALIATLPASPRRAALARRSLAGAPTGPALPRRKADLERRLRLRRQRAARQEVPRAATRLMAGASGRLARRAHAHHRRGRSAGRGDVHRGGDAERIGEDQSGHGGLVAARLARVDPRRRHRVDSRRCPRSAAGNQPRARVLRRGAQHQPEDEPERDGDGEKQHDLHQRRTHRFRRAVVGRPHAAATVRPVGLAGAAVET